MTLEAEVAALRRETDTLEQLLSCLDPHGDYALFQLDARGLWRLEAFGADLSKRDDPIAFQHAVYSARQQYMARRYQELSARAAEREQRRAERLAGLSRFVGEGRFDLGALTETTATTPLAREQIRQEQRDRARQEREAEIARLRDVREGRGT